MRPEARAADSIDAYVRAIVVREFLEDRRSSWIRRVTLTSCGAPVDGLSVNIDELGVGAHPHLGLSPMQLMERMQLLGTNPADWVTNPLP